MASTIKMQTKIFCTYLLPCFLFENMKKIIFQTSNLPLAFQKKMKLLVYFMGISNLPLAFQNNLCHIIWT